MHHRHTRRAAALALGLPLLATAQGRPDPADPKAPARPLTHASAFADYRPYGDIAPGDWRRLNDTVGRAAPGSGAAPAAATRPAPAAAPAAPAASSPTAKTPMTDMPGHGPHLHGGRP